MRRRQLAVRGEAAEVEERRVEAGIVPVDQPQPLAVVDEVGGQQVVVAEDELDRPDGPLQPLGARRAVAAASARWRLPRLAQACARSRARRGTPRRSAPGPRRCFGISRWQRADQRRRCASRLAGSRTSSGVKRAALDEVEHEHARLGMDDRGRDAGRMRGAAGGELVRAHDAVHRDVAADAHDEAARRASSTTKLVLVMPPRERLAARPAAPDRQRGGLPPRRADRRRAHALRLSQGRASASRARPRPSSAGRRSWRSWRRQAPRRCRARHRPWRARYRPPGRGRACRPAR